jgi:hypothetical protein
MNTALLAIDPALKRVRRYVRRDLGLGVVRLECSHEAVFENGEPLVTELNHFRVQPREFPQDHTPRTA